MIKGNFLRGAVLATVMVSPAALAQGPGYGYGPEMMGGGMMSGPMMGGGPGYGRGPLVAALNLSDEQREKIFAVQEENWRKNWETMGQMRAEMFRLRSMSFADKIDAKAYSEQEKKVDDLRRQIIASRIESGNQIEQILTPEQRKQLRSSGPWWPQAGAIALAASAQTYRIPDLKPPPPRVASAPRTGEPCNGCARILSIREVNTVRGLPSAAVGPVPGAEPGSLTQQNLIGAVIYLPLGDKSTGDRPYVGPAGTPEMYARMRETTYEVALRMDDGTVRIVRHPDGSSFSVGDRVRWLGGNDLELLVSN